MDASISTLADSQSWQVVSSSTVALAVLFALSAYLFFRHVVLTLMVLDLVIGWLRRFRWFPLEGGRLKTVVHWIIAVGAFNAYLALAWSMGWIQFIPK